jgi:transcriptional regulator with XRE-family HTH domain
LGQRVRELRLKRGYSQESFAGHCGVYRTFLGTIERGESNLSFSNLVKTANGLGITLSELLSGLEKKASAPQLASTLPRRHAGMSHRRSGEGGSDLISHRRGVGISSLIT